MMQVKASPAIRRGLLMNIQHKRIKKQDAGMISEDARMINAEH
jgi:hypothetical protein